MELTILMPCLNEAETLAICIQKAAQYLQRYHIKGEILIADNGSHDGSQAIAKAHGARLIDAPVKGYGAALLAGIAAAKGKFIIMGDADDSYDFSNLHAYLEKLRAGFDLVMGNRFQGGIQKGAMPFLNYYLGNPVLSFLGRLFFKSNIGDFHCGLRGFNKETILTLNLQAPGMEFASEMVIKATLKNIRITEVPTVLAPDGRSRPPHLRKWRDGWRHLSLLLQYSPRWLFLYPGIFLAVLGMLLMIVLGITPLQVGAHTLSIHTLLFASGLFLIGLQCISFSMFARLLACKRLQLPLSKRATNLLNYFTLDRGVLFGTCLFLGGFLAAFASVIIWAKTGFGDLMPAKMMRLAIPSVTCLIAGVQIIFTAFFLHLLLSSGAD